METLQQQIQQMHSASELKSALQKFIRRGLHDDAVSVASELCNLMLHQNGEGGRDVQLWETFWRRLHTIATEDIGIAQYGTHTYLNAAKEEAARYFFDSTMDDKDSAFRDVCLRAVQTLSYSPKSRLTDNAYILFKQSHLTVSPNFENLYKYIENRQESALLELIVSVYRQRKGDSIKMRDVDVYMAIRNSMEKDYLLEEVETIWAIYQARPCVLYLMHLALLLCRPPAKLMIPRTSLPEVKDLQELPDFVYDMHTMRGINMGRGFGNFIRVSCILENCSIPDPYYEQLLEMTSDETSWP